MIGVIFGVIAVLATLADMVMIRLLAAALKNAGYVDHVCTWDQAFWIAVVLSMIAAIAAFFKGALDAL